MADISSLLSECRCAGETIKRHREASLATTFETRGIPARALEIADRVEAFVRDVVAPYEHDSRLGAHGPSPEMVEEMRALAREADVMTPHILADGSHLTHRETAAVLIRSGLSPLGPTAVNTAAPDEGNMY